MRNISKTTRTTMPRREAAARKLMPESLDTPTDLSHNAVTALTGSLNALVADAFALYLKTKNFHWHMSGPHFRDYHLLLDEHAEQILRHDRSFGRAGAQARRQDIALDRRHRPHATPAGQ
jgi:hypothetical protein